MIIRNSDSKVHTIVMLLAVIVIGVTPLLAQQNSEIMDNQRVVQLYTSGVHVDELIRLIQTAPQVSFALFPASTDALLQAGIPESVIKAMAARQSGNIVQPTTSGPGVPTPAKKGQKERAAPASQPLASPQMPSAAPAPPVPAQMPAPAQQPPIPPVAPVPATPQQAQMPPVAPAPGQMPPVAPYPYPSKSRDSSNEYIHRGSWEIGLSGFLFIPHASLSDSYGFGSIRTGYYFARNSLVGADFAVFAVRGGQLYFPSGFYRYVQHTANPRFFPFFGAAAGADIAHSGGSTGHVFVARAEAGIKYFVSRNVSRAE